MAKLRARVYKLEPIIKKEYGDKTFYERDLVVDATRFDPYTGDVGRPNFPVFRINGEDRCREYSVLRKGDLVDVEYYINGVKYEGDNGEEKFFTYNAAYKVTIIEESTSQQPAEALAPSTGGELAKKDGGDDEYAADDLPF